MDRRSKASFTVVVLLLLVAIQLAVAASRRVPPQEGGDPEIFYDEEVSYLASNSSGRLLAVQTDEFLFELKSGNKAIPLIANDSASWRVIDGPAKVAAFPGYIKAILPLPADELIVGDSYAFRHVDKLGHVKTIRYYNPAGEMANRAQDIRLKKANVPTNAVDVTAPRIFTSAVALGPDGAIYCSDTITQAVYRVEMTGQTTVYSRILTTKANPAVLNNNNGMVVDAQTNVFVITHPFGVYKVPPSQGDLILYLDLSKLEGKYPEALLGSFIQMKFDREGRLWICGESSMIVVWPDRRVSLMNKGIEKPTQWMRGRHFTFDAAGDLYTHNHAYVFRYPAALWQKQLAQPTYE